MEAYKDKKSEIDALIDSIESTNDNRTVIEEIKKFNDMLFEKISTYIDNTELIEFQEVFYKEIQQLLDSCMDLRIFKASFDLIKLKFRRLLLKIDF